MKPYLTLNVNPSYIKVANLESIFRENGFVTEYDPEQFVLKIYSHEQMKEMQAAMASGDVNKYPKDFIQYSPSGILLPLSDRNALEVLSRFFLTDEDVANIPATAVRQQTNVYLVHEILNKFKRKYKKFCKRSNWNTIR